MYSAHESDFWSVALKPKLLRRPKTEVSGRITAVALGIYKGAII